MEAWVTEIVGKLGYVGVALLMFLENVFPPLPSELIMPLAGFAAGRGEMTLWGVIVAGCVGAVLGQFPLYYAGRALGEKRLHALAERHGKWVAVRGRDIDRASGWLRKRGPAAVLLCRLVPGVRSLISIPAGVSRLNLLTFTVYSTIGIAAWGALLATLGYMLGENYELVEEYVGPIGTGVFVLLGLALLGWLGYRYWTCFRPGVACDGDEPERPAKAPA